MRRSERTSSTSNIPTTRERHDPSNCYSDPITETQKDLASSFLPAPIVGHVADGNFHVGFVLDPNDPKEMAEVARLNQRLVHRALALEGICTGEHGIGCGKLDFLIAEHGEAGEHHARNQAGARFNAPVRVAFHYANSVSTLN
jgi:FAD/FMN-containing dehydrogenase